MWRTARAAAIIRLSWGLACALAFLGPGPAYAAAPPTRLSPESRERLAQAVTSYEAADWTTAARAFAEAAPAAAPISEYAYYLQAEGLARSGDAAGARVAALKAVENAADGPLLPAALLLAAREASKSGDEAIATLCLRRFLERYPEHPDSAAARLALGQSLEAQNLGAEAVAAYRALWILAPASTQATTAAPRMRALVDRGVPAAPLTARERLERAERLLSAGQHATARTEAEALLAEGWPADVASRAYRVSAESLRRTGRPDDALRVVDRAIAGLPADRRAGWLLERARLTQRSRDQAVAAIDRILRDHRRSPEAPEALLLRAQILESAPAAAEAEAALARLAADYPDSEEAPTALWRLGWASWLRGTPAVAAERWTRAAGLRAGHRLREAAEYWVARARAEQGDADGARRQWAAVAAGSPRGYYGLLAAARLGRDGSSPAGDAARPGTTLPSDPLELLQGDQRYAKVEALRAIGLEQFADGELAELGRRSAGDTPRLFAVSAAWGQESRHHMALRILRRDFVVLARSGSPALPRVFWELFYPFGWRAEITAAASRAALDPMFVAAVVREESSYDPRARSRVGARGLMQLMPDTGRSVARQRGLPFLDGGATLDEPAANLELGATFIGGLVRDFGDPRLAVAAYNAGPRRVREWWNARRSDDLEVWVEQIPFDETRAFVKRVMVAWEEYRRLYAGGP